MLDPATLAAIRSEVEAGLLHEQGRLEQSRRNVFFYRGEFDAYWEHLDEDDYESPRFRRPSLLMQWAVNTLGRLYAAGPAREVADDPAAAKWLVDLYTREGVDGLLQEADRLAIAADVCAVQVVATGDPARPIRFALWPAHQFVVWESADDPTEPAAVATIDCFDNRRRLRVYTPDALLTYETDKAGPGQTAGGTAYRLVDEEANPFGLLPFAFVHANPPATEFWSHGPGDVLQAVNDYLNYGLTRTAQSIEAGLRPIVKVFGAGAWRPPTPVRPGSIWHIPAAAYDEAQNGIPADVDYLQPDPGFIEADWADKQSMIDHALQTVNVPPATFRMVQTGAASGVAIVAEQLPVLQAIEAKRRPFLAYERRLARVALAVGGLDPAKADGLTLRWPEVVPRSLLYGPQEDEADQADLDLGLTSRIQIVMRRLNIGREQAVEHLQQVARDLAEEEEIGIPPVPTKQPQPAALGQEDANDASRSEERDDAGEGAGGAGGRPGAEG